MKEQNNNEVVTRPVFLRTKETESAIKAMREVAIGDTITWNAITLAIGSDATAHRGSIQTARRELQKEGILFASVPGVGYKRLDDSGIVHSEADASARLTRSAKRSLKRLSVVKPENLHPLDRTQYAVTTAVAGAIALCGGRQKRALIEQAVTDKGGALEIGETMKLFQK